MQLENKADDEANMNSVKLHESSVLDVFDGIRKRKCSVGFILFIITLPFFAYYLLASSYC